MSSAAFSRTTVRVRIANSSVFRTPPAVSVAAYFVFSRSWVLAMRSSSLG